MLPHYFGYEGRCATPSLFDANYCYSLGATVGMIGEILLVKLISIKCNGYLALIRNLKAPPSDWIPSALPFTYAMQVKCDPLTKVFIIIDFCTGRISSN